MRVGVAVMDGGTAHAVRPQDAWTGPRHRWSFANPTAATFVEHAEASIPMYRDGHRLILELSDFFVRPGGRVYDLGCSTGVLAGALARRHPGADVVGVDCEADMIALAAEAAPQARTLHGEIAGLDFEPCDLVIAHYVLQFAGVEQRADVLARIVQALRPGGALIMFEKTYFDTARTHDVAAQIYHSWKLDRGHTAAAVMAKSEDLRGVLEPLPAPVHERMLRAAGFVDVVSVAQWLAFRGWLAVKPS